jgi:hypothetical protein
MLKVVSGAANSFDAASNVASASDHCVFLTNATPLLNISRAWPCGSLAAGGAPDGDGAGASSSAEASEIVESKTRTTLRAELRGCSIAGCSRYSSPFAAKPHRDWRG